MKYIYLLLATLGICMPTVQAQQRIKQPPAMTTKNLQTITNPLIKAALVAINERDAAAWYAVFSPKPHFSDDGRKLDFKQWSDQELFGKSACAILSIDKLEDQGLSVYCLFHSDKYGDFKTFMRFQQEGNHLTKLDVGQTDY